VRVDTPHVTYKHRCPRDAVQRRSHPNARYRNASHGHDNEVSEGLALRPLCAFYMLMGVLPCA
jgi:hypothetical protein